MKEHGQLRWHDAGGKFDSAKHGILNLIDDTDICIYSLTEKGNTAPTWLIVKLAKAGWMERYPDDPDADLRQCGLTMEKYNYEQWSPKSLFREVSDLTYSCKYMVKKNMDVEFYENQGLFKDAILTAAEFFSMEVEGPGSEIYLRDKAYFVK